MSFIIFLLFMSVFFIQNGSLILVHPRISHENINNEFLVLFLKKLRYT
jgi:hypothetical protein